LSPENENGTRFRNDQQQQQQQQQQQPRPFGEQRVPPDLGEQRTDEGASTGAKAARGRDLQGANLAFDKFFVR
jgi:hypothetical protein